MTWRYLESRKAQPQTTPPVQPMMKSSEVLSWCLVVLLAASSAELVAALFSVSAQSEPRPFLPLPPAATEKAPPAPQVKALLETSGGNSEPKEELVKHKGVQTQVPVLSLRGTLAGPDGSGVAFLERAGKLHTLNQGDALPETAITLSFVPGHWVHLKVDDEIYALEVGSTLGSGKARQAEPQADLTPLGRRELQAHLDNPAFLRSIKIDPALKEGRMEGVILHFKGPQHPFTRLGLKSGDIVKNINQTPLDKAGVLSELLPLLRNSQTLTLQIERDGTAQTVRVEMED